MLALRAARLFDGWSDKLLERPLVLIENGRITAIEYGDLDAPQGAEFVDLGEATLLPGLIDNHVHLGFGASTAPVAHLRDRRPAAMARPGGRVSPPQRTAAPAGPGRQPAGAGKRATVHCRVLPDLGSLRPRDVTFVSGEPRLQLEIAGVTEPWLVGSSQ